MFGYVRPVKCNLTEEGQARFRSVYCGLCHALGRRYGLLARFILNYDFAYLALVLGAFAEEAPACRARCLRHPVCGCMYRQPDEPLNLAADLSLILTYHKLSDTIQDERGFRRILARLLRFLFQRKYRKAARLHPGYDREVCAHLSVLSALEAQQCASIDEVADTFAHILSSAAAQADLGADNNRVLKQLFYHMGRWIYLIDACNDLEEDFASGNYNPVRLRFSLLEPKLTGQAREQLQFTLEHSLASCAAAFELLSFSRDRDIILNIIYFGLRMVTTSVLDGTWGRKEEKNR